MFHRKGCVMARSALLGPLSLLGVAGMLLLLHLRLRSLQATVARPLPTPPPRPGARASDVIAPARPRLGGERADPERGGQPASQATGKGGRGADWTRLERVSGEKTGRVSGEKTGPLSGAETGPVSGEKTGGRVSGAAAAGPDMGRAADNVTSDGEVRALTQILDMRLAQEGDVAPVYGTRNCSTLTAAGNVRGPCVDPSCERPLPASTETRVRQLLVPRLRPQPEHLAAISAMARDVPPTKYIFVTAASANHYNESQALVHDLTQHVFPSLPQDSFAFYYFDLGLTAVQRRRVAKHCHCTLMDVDFRSLPRHVRDPMCYSWKPVIVQALLPRAEVLVYMDVSVRFRDTDLHALFSSARRWGTRFLSNVDALPNHTVREMFAFYGDLPCAYWASPELLAGFSVLHNEPFVRRLVVAPWLACALHADCMCPVEPRAFRRCPHRERLVGQCHRFDLSSLTLQLAKLYGDKMGKLVMGSGKRPVIARGDTMDYFTD